jgi:hypothetical protein
MLKFTIRDLLWLTVLAVVGVAFALREGQLRDARLEAELAAQDWENQARFIASAIEHDGYEVWFRDDTPDNDRTMVVPPREPTPNPRPLDVGDDEDSVMFRDLKVQK